jgi:hypothetical protein
MQRLVAHNGRLKMMGRSELCAWLRANSSGDYRPAAEAADEIEHLAEAKDSHFAQAMANGAKAREYRDEADALRKDAERYRKLRAALGPGRFSMMAPRINVPFEPGQTYTPEGLDAALDALPAVGAA